LLKSYTGLFWGLLFCVFLCFRLSTIQPGLFRVFDATKHYNHTSFSLIFAIRPEAGTGRMAYSGSSDNDSSQGQLSRAGTPNMSDGADVDREKAVRATLRVVLPRAPVGTFGDARSLRQDMQVQRTRSAPKSPHAENLDAAARTLASPVGPDTPSRISRERFRKPSVPSDTDRVDHHPSESPRPFLRPTTPVRVVSLETRLAELRSAQKRISPPSTAAIMYQLTRAVAHAAGLGVCHGDITPSCVLLSVPSMHISLTGMCTDSGTRSVCFLPPRALESHMHAMKRSTDRRFWSIT
jgi:hypothetical protein